VQPDPAADEPTMPDEPLRVVPEATPNDAPAASTTPTLTTPIDWFAGAPFTPETYPIERLRRPLTLVPSMFELLASFGIDLSSGVAGEQLALNLDGHYALAPFTELGAELGSLDIRSFGDSFRGAVYTRRQVLRPLALRGDLLLDRVQTTVTTTDTMGITTTETTGRRRLGAAAGLPLKLVASSRFGIEALERVVYIRTNPRSATIALPVTLIWQPLSSVVVEALATPTIDQPTDASFSLPVALGAVVSFSNATDLALKFRMFDVAGDLGGRDLLINLTMRM